MATCVATTAWASITIGGKEYAADTLVRRQIGPGIMHTMMRLPDFPLNVYILETDVTNPANRVESTIGYDQVGRTEALVNAAKRHTTATKRPVAACNANFWIVSGSGAPLSTYGTGTPLGCVVRNDTTYVNSPTTTDGFNGGPWNTGATAITADRVYVGRWMWAGTVRSPKINGGEALTYHNINRRCKSGEMALWNRGYSATREFENNWTGHNERGDNESDNYYLMMKEGSNWAVGKDMTFVVKKIIRNADRQTLGDYDACLTAAKGDLKTAMTALEEGDEIVVTTAWTTYDTYVAETPVIENMVEGNAPVLHRGQLDPRNYNEAYNTMVYSRTAYGTNAEGTRLYMIVIDKSTSKKYGVSAGCTTEQMYQILQSVCPDVTEVANYDAGGSAEMMVRGEIINTTTEGTPRAVASGMMLVAVGEEDNTLASIAFDEYRINAPVYSSSTPRILGYNARGELIDEDVQGFTLSCDEHLGHTEGSTFIAGGEDGHGLLTATLNGMTATVPVRTLAAQPAISIKPCIVIDDREYAVDVTATVNNVTYNYDPTKLGWNIDNPEVATITSGTLRGVANGTTTLHCTIGDLTDEVEVRTQISDVPYQYQDWSDWTLKGSGAKNIKLDENGTVAFTYSGGRAPYLQMRKEIEFYGLPDTIGVTFTSTVPVDYVQIDMRNRYFTTAHYVKHGEDTGFEAGKEYTVAFDLAAMGGTENVGTYPLTMNELRFVPSKNGETGEHTIAIKRFFTHYNVTGTGIKGDVNGDGQVDVIDANTLINIVLGKDDAEKYAGRANVNGVGDIDVSDVNGLINIILGK